MEPMLFRKHCSSCKSVIENRDDWGSTVAGHWRRPTRKGEQRYEHDHKRGGQLGDLVPVYWPDVAWEAVADYADLLGGYGELAGHSGSRLCRSCAFASLRTWADLVGSALDKWPSGRPSLDDQFELRIELVEGWVRRHGALDPSRVPSPKSLLDDFLREMAARGHPGSRVYTLTRPREVRRGIRRRRIVQEEPIDTQRGWIVGEDDYYTSEYWLITADAQVWLDSGQEAKGSFGDHYTTFTLAEARKEGAMRARDPSVVMSYPIDRKMGLTRLRVESIPLDVLYSQLSSIRSRHLPN